MTTIHHDTFTGTAPHIYPASTRSTFRFDRRTDSERDAALADRLTTADPFAAAMVHASPSATPGNLTLAYDERIGLLAWPYEVGDKVASDVLLYGPSSFSFPFGSIEGRAIDGNWVRNRALLASDGRPWTE